MCQVWYVSDLKVIGNRIYKAVFKDRNALNLIDSLLVLDPSLRLDAEQALDHLFFFTQPHPAADVKDLMSTISVCYFVDLILCSTKYEFQTIANSGLETIYWLLAYFLC